MICLGANKNTSLLKKVVDEGGRGGDKGWDISLSQQEGQGLRAQGGSTASLSFPQLFTLSLDFTIWLTSSFVKILLNLGSVNLKPKAHTM